MYLRIWRPSGTTSSHIPPWAVYLPLSLGPTFWWRRQQARVSTRITMIHSVFSMFFRERLTWHSSRQIKRALSSISVLIFSRNSSEGIHSLASSQRSMAQTTASAKKSKVNSSDRSSPNTLAMRSAKRGRMYSWRCSLKEFW